MPRNNYISISLSQGVRQDVPSTLLPLPFLTRAENLITRNQGRLESRPTFKKITQLPANSGTPLKIFTYPACNDALYCITDRYILIYNKANNQWVDAISHEIPPTGLGEIRNISSDICPIIQKERDITNLGFSKFGDNLIFFYTYNPTPFTPGTIFYTQFGLTEKRVTYPERTFTLDNSDPTGMFALNVDSDLWLGISYENSIRIVKINNLSPFQISSGNSVIRNISGIKKFKLYKDRVFYTTDGNTIRSIVYNPTATDKALNTDQTISDLRDSESNAVGFNNQNLYDFRNWVDFSYSNQDYKMIWSLNTGYFLLNNNNIIIAHLYARHVPEILGTPPRVQYSGNAVIEGNMVYIPVLRSGQAEVVNREAITDRIVPSGTQELVSFRPLGLELLTFDMESKIPPEVAHIGRQCLISGPVLRWTGGVKLSEYSFTEKPVISKTPRFDYDRWPYSDLETDRPLPTELETGQFTPVQIQLNSKKSPYLIDDLSFTAGISGADIGIGTRFGSWASNSTPLKRTLRYSSATNSRNVEDAYGGVLTRIYFDDSEKALVVVYLNVPSTLETGKDHPQGILINNLTYLYDSMSLSGRTLTCYHHIAESPLTSGQTYEVVQPYADVLRPESALNSTVQNANSDNQNTKIVLNDLRFRKLQKIEGRDTTIDPQPLKTATVGLVSLNPRNDRGAFARSGIKDTFGVRATTNYRDETKDISLGSGSWEGSLTDGTTIWFIDDDDNYARAYRVSDQERDRNKDINLGHGNWSGGFYENGRLWFFDVGSGDLYVFNASNLNRFEAIQVELPFSGDFADYTWVSAVSNGLPDEEFRLYTVHKNDNTNNYELLRWRLSSYEGRNIRPIHIRTNSWRFGRNVIKGAFSNWTPSTRATVTWFIDDTDNKAQAFNIISDTSDAMFRNRALDIPLGSGGWESGVFADNTIWCTDRNNNAKAFFTTPYIAPTNVNGTLTNNTDIANKIELSAIWTEGSKLYVVFGALTSDFATSSRLSSAIMSAFDHFFFDRTGATEIRTNRSSFINSRSYTISGRVYIRYEINNFSTNQGLKNFLASTQNFSMEFFTAQMPGFVEVPKEIQPQVLSTTYNSFDDNDAPKEINYNEINDTISLYQASNLLQVSSFYFPPESFKKVKGSVGNNNYYYLETTEAPLKYNVNVLHFDESTIYIRYVYPLIDVSVELTPERLMSNVYNYRARYKWLDENGIEHRSQLSNNLQIVTNHEREIGIPGNQPSFSLSFLNLTNKERGSVIIEVYRTKRNSRTYQFLTEKQSNETQESIEFTDTFEDNRLGAPMSNDVESVSGARHVLNYKGRWVLWGFPDKPNRILVSSAENPFSNQVVAFQDRSLIGGTIEILMEINVEAICVMDNYLIISGDNQVYNWALRDNTFRQEKPVKVTGLGNYAIADVRSYVETTEGIMFNDVRGRGIQLLTRGLSWKFIGEPVKDSTTLGKTLSCFSNNENVYFLKERNPDNPETPQVLVYNQRYKTWSSYDNKDLISGLIWDNKLTALAEDGGLWQEVDEAPQRTETFIIETGWINFTQIFMEYHRLRDVYLLGDFTGLEAMSLEMDFNFIQGENYEKIDINLSGYSDSPTLYGGAVIGAPSLRDKKEFRFQPRNQPGTAIQLKFTIVARTAKIDAIRFGGYWSGKITKTQAVVSGGRP